MENDPLVTINILSYNRKDELRHTLQMVYDQDYKKIEVIVVDNASTDGTMEMVKSNYPEVRLIRLSQNIGISGWNAGFKVANGEFVMVLDDDSYPAENTIAEGIQEFWKDEGLGIITFNVYNTRTAKSETENFMPQPYFFHGCGAMFRKKIIKDVGKFNELIFIYYHELDYSARAYNANYKIKYLPTLTIYHEQSIQSRGLNLHENNPFKSEYRYYHYFISYSIILLQRFSWKHVIKYLLKWILNRFIICIYSSYYKSFSKALFHLMMNFGKILNGRRVLTKDIQHFYNNGNEALIDRSYFVNFQKPKYF